MSTPNSGLLKVRIDGIHCWFDGAKWTTPDPALTARLDEAMSFVPVHHMSILEVAQAVLRLEGLTEKSSVLEWKNDEWSEDLSEGDVD